MKICLGKRFRCDNYVQCEDARDEDNCEEEYLNRGIFTRNDRFLCGSPYLETTAAQFFPMRAIRCAVLIICGILSMIRVKDHYLYRNGHQVRWDEAMSTGR